MQALAARQQKLQQLTNTQFPLMEEGFSSGHDYGVGGATAMAYQEDRQSNEQLRRTHQRLNHRGTCRPATVDRQDHGYAQPGSCGDTETGTGTITRSKWRP